MARVVKRDALGREAAGSFPITLQPAAPAGDWILDPMDFPPAGRIIGQRFTSDLTLSNVEKRIYVNCIFERQVQLEGCRDVAFLNMQRTGQGGSGSQRGIRLSNGGAGTENPAFRCHNITIEGGWIRNCSYDGISVAGNCLPDGTPFHTNVRIRKLLVENVGTNDGKPGGPYGGLRHGIYTWGPIWMEDVFFKECNGGNAVSARGGGVFERIYVRGASESGLGYFCDHPEGQYSPQIGKKWIVRGSVVCDVNRQGNGSDGCIFGKDVPTPNNLVTHIEITDNFGDRSPVARISSGYTGVVQTLRNNVTKTRAECVAMLPTNYPLLAA